MADMRTMCVRYRWGVVACLGVLLAMGCAGPEMIEAVAVRHDSPEAVFEAFRSALAERDYGRLLDTQDPRLRREWETLLKWTKAFESGRQEAGADASSPSEYDVLARMNAQYVGQDITYERQEADLVFAMVSEEGPGVPLGRYRGKWYVSPYFGDLEDGRYSLALAAEIMKSECQKLGIVPPAGLDESGQPGLEETQGIHTAREIHTAPIPE